MLPSCLRYAHCKIENKKIIDEKFSDKLSSLPRNSSDDLNVIVIPSNELEVSNEEGFKCSREYEFFL